MAITWGAYDSNLAVGIDVTISGETVTVKYYVKTSTGGWDWNDDQRLSRTGWITGGTDYHNDLDGPSESMLVYSTTKTGSRGSSYTVGAYVTGAYNGASPSHSRSFTVPAIEPSKPGTPAVSNLTGTSFTLTWTAPSDNGGAAITSYRLEVDDNASFTSPQVFTGNTDRSQNVTGKTPGSRLYARVQATNSAGDSVWSNTRTIDMLDYPDAPTQTAPTAITAETATVNWTAPGDDGGATITGYVVEYDTDPAFGSPQAFTMGAAARSAPLTELTPGAAYSVRISAINSVGTGSPSNVQTVATLAGFKPYDGSAFADVVPKVYDGAAFADAVPQVYDGAGWVVPV